MKFVELSIYMGVIGSEEPEEIMAAIEPLEDKIFLAVDGAQLAGGIETVFAASATGITDSVE